jgi:hypothetical protein
MQLRSEKLDVVYVGRAVSLRGVRRLLLTGSPPEGTQVAGPRGCAPRATQSP